MMNFFRVTVLLLLMICVSILTNAQCDINLGCIDEPVLNIDPPTFDPVSSSIVLDNIELGGFQCSMDTTVLYQVGIAVYIYQLLPDGSRMTQCAVLNEPPYNVVGSVAFGFGQVSFCSIVVPIGSFMVGPAEGYEACDGAYLEIEAALFVTDNLDFDSGITSVYSELTDNEYQIVNLGNLEINIEDESEFPGQGQPLTTAKIKDFNSDSEGPMTMACGEDIELYLEGLSRIANCLPYDDISTGISSELTNEFYYRINDGEPVIVLDESTGATGGQLTGPDAALDGLCYAGVLSTEAYRLEFAELPADLCDGSTIVFTLKTIDLFTNATAEDQFTVIYTGGTGCGAACAVEPHCDNPCYAEYNPNPSDGSAADPAECLTVLDCETIIADGLEATCADVANCDVLGCTNICASNYNPDATVDDDSCMLPEPPATECYETATLNNTTCEWEITGEIPQEPETGCDEDTRFNDSTCMWEIIDSPVGQDPRLECYETATYNTTTCEWEIEGIMPPEPETECYETATFNDTTCMWEVTGEMPPEPRIACYQTSTFNNDPTVCNWEVEGIMPPEPPLACYETSDFNTTTCIWDVSGTQPPRPTDLGCLESVGNFDDASCTWQILVGVEPPIDDGCDLTTDFYDDLTCMVVNTSTCPDGTSLDEVNCVCVDIPVPGCTNECASNYNPAANQDDGSCMLPEEQPTACYETATFNNTTCVWDVTGLQPDPPILECYETLVSFDNETCRWLVEGEPPLTDDGCNLTTDSFNEETCEVINTPNCLDGTTFNTSTCMCDTDPIPGCTEPCATNYNPAANADDGSCMLPDPDDGCDLTEDTFNNETCEIVNTPNCSDFTTFDETSCECIVIDIEGCLDECALNYNSEANIDDGSCEFPDPDDGCDLTTDTIDDNCMIVNTPDCPSYTEFIAATCECMIIDGLCCTDPCASNFDPDCTIDNGSCYRLDLDDNCDITDDTIDPNTCEIIRTPNCPDGTNFNAMECSCDDTDCVPPTPGTIDCE